MRIFRELLLHISVVCCLVSVITKVLDWYNPYMDFSGHVWYVQALLYVSVLLLAVTHRSHTSFMKHTKTKIC